MQQLLSDFSKGRGQWGVAVMGDFMGHRRFEPSHEELGQCHKQGHCAKWWGCLEECKLMEKAQNYRLLDKMGVDTLLLVKQNKYNM